MQACRWTIALIACLGAAAGCSAATAAGTGRPEAQPATVAMTGAEVGDWLDAYRRAWQEQDAALVTRLFSADARYAVNPFDKVLSGREAIGAYWRSGAAGSQTDIVFDHELWAVNGNAAIAHWTASFTRTRTRERVAMDGVFRLTFERGEGRRLVCRSLDQWWFMTGEAAAAGARRPD